MSNWKNLAANPPIENCSVVLKAPDGETARYSLAVYESATDTLTILSDPEQAGERHTFKASETEGCLYVNLDDIK